MAALLAFPAAAQEGDIQALYEAARREGRLVWFVSDPEDAVLRIAQKFNAEYPGIRIEQVRIRGVDCYNRVLIETQAGRATGDVVTCMSEGQILDLMQRGMLKDIDWVAWGVEPELLRGGVAVSSLATLYGVAYNTRLVKPEEVPASWDDLLHPRWKNRLGFWIQPYALAYLVAAWGEERAVEFARALKDQNPVYYQSSFPMAASITAGEIPLGVAAMQAVADAQAQGAPIEGVFLDPVGVTLLNTVVPENAGNPNAATLFTLWLASDAGVRALEEETHRGNPFHPATEAYQRLRNVSTAYFEFEEAHLESHWLSEMAKVLELE